MAIPDHRETLPLQTIYDEAGYLDQMPFDLFRELMTHVSEELGIPAGKLRLSDRFDAELAPARGNEFDSAVAMLAYDLKLAAKRHKRKLDMSVETLDGYLRLMSELY
ncbi:hypothetical protein IM816_04605 [Luteibacter flocculans]|uniref:Uncharacterized protein n=1 Tax=Luteibacter flocculans TaxID=2780091 RepID=A0ABY4T5B4_9GAMM|nr:hypothetical protein [Luteibacter flocculans]URL59395.1 hypothetical protein IM816_04605 [Luteibacter flocculans]